MKQIANLYPDATVICVVFDNLNIHKVASLYEAFPDERARELARRQESHYLCPVVASQKRGGS
jgi:hypothetical protein